LQKKKKKGKERRAKNNKREELHRSRKKYTKNRARLHSTELEEDENKTEKRGEKKTPTAQVRKKTQKQE
jgi:hypothetical protein